MQVDPINAKLKAAGTKRLKLKCPMLLSTPAFNFNLRRYIEAQYSSLLDQASVERAAALSAAAGASTAAATAREAAVRTECRSRFSAESAAAATALRTGAQCHEVGRCMLTLSTPCRKRLDLCS